MDYKRAYTHPRGQPRGKDVELWVPIAGPMVDRLAQRRINGPDRGEAAARAPHRRCPCHRREPHRAPGEPRG
eukprot:9698092-Alexandrium_andersonii.AAC.1